MRIIKFLIAVVLLTIVIILSGCPPANQPESGQQAPVTRSMAPAAGSNLTIFAGAASKPALDELAKLYEQQAGGKVEITYGGSGAVLTQFTQEQFGDIYIPGSDDFMDKAEKKDAVLKETRSVLVYLVPVINVAQGNPKQVKGLSDLAREDVRVVIGEPSTVCLGAIAKAALEQTKLWEKVQPKLANYAGNCEDVLQALLLGEADAVIGWDVFTRQQPDKVESVALPAEVARPLNIPAAVIKWSSQVEAAREFVKFLTIDESKTVWEKHGYTVQAPSGS